MSADHIPPAAPCSYPARDGNLVRPMVDGADVFGRIGDAVEAARRSVWLTVAFYAISPFLAGKACSTSWIAPPAGAWTCGCGPGGRIPRASITVS